LESQLLPLETHDFSENNLKNRHGFDQRPCGGGSGLMATAYLARWSGPVDESMDPYQAVDSNTSPLSLPAQKHVQDVIIIAGRGSALNNDELKNAVMTYGAVMTSMYETADPTAYNPATGAYYYSGSTIRNHGVTLVGWDDNYSRNNFAVAPPGDGAFLIKNSHGTSSGKQGYFWISYYDSQYAMTEESYAFVTSEEVTNYSRRYEYDPLGWVSSYGSDSPTAWYANVFTAADTEDLRAIATYAARNNSPYTITVYTGIADVPTSGTLAETVEGTFAQAGYHTVRLPNSVRLLPGQKFAVVVKLTTPGYNSPIPIELVIPGLSSAARANPGESFGSADGVTWIDATSVDSTANVVLKAFSSLVPKPTKTELKTTTSSPVVGSPVTLTATVTGDASTRSGSVTFKEGNSFLGSGTLNSIGQAMYSTTSLSQGPHSITATYEGDVANASSTSDAITVTVSDFSLPASIPSVSLIAGETKTATFAVSPVSGFTGTVSVACAVPANMTGASCSASPVQLAGSSGDSTLTVKTTGTGPIRITAISPRDTWLTACFGLVPVGLFWVGNPASRRRLRGWLICFVLTVLIAGAVSCGGNNKKDHTDSGTQAGTYLLTVTATSGTASHTMSVTVVVQ
jgi:hypothetical protein